MKKILYLLCLIPSLALAQSNAFMKSKQADIQRMKERDFFSEILAEYKKSNKKYRNQDLVSGKVFAASTIEYSLAVQEVWSEIGYLYRDYGMLKHDYFKSIETINNFEKIADEILKNCIAKNEDQKKEYEVGLLIYKQFALDYKEDLEKYGFVEFLQQKYEFALNDIEQGRIQCEEKCKKQIQQIPVLIDEINQNIAHTDAKYLAMLGHEIIDKAIKY